MTGGASGLGRALAERYARSGWRVLIGDIDAARTEETVAAVRARGATIAGSRCDVRREEDLEAAARWLEAEWGGVDVVVNNAGVALAGGIAETSLADWGWIVDINLLGVVRGCKAFTPMFRRQGRGRFVNVASLSGLVHPPLMSAYTATKAAVVALSESLLLELAPDGIAVSVVCPSFFRTGLHETARATSQELAASTRRLVAGAGRSAEEIAERVFKGVARGDFHILTDAEGHLAWMPGVWGALVPVTPTPGVLAFVDVEYRTGGLDPVRFSRSSRVAMPDDHVPRIRAIDTCLAPE